MKDAVWAIFEQLQENPKADHNLLVWAKAHPGEFYTKIAARLIPQQLTGAGGGPIRIVDAARLAAMPDAELERFEQFLEEIGVYKEPDRQDAKDAAT